MEHVTMTASEIRAKSVMMGVGLGAWCVVGMAWAEPEKGTGEKAATAEVVVAGVKVEAFKQEIPAGAYAMEMTPIPGDEGKKIAPFFMSRTEVTWDAFNPFLYAKDDEAGLAALGADVVTRPSRPYIPPDCGFGVQGYAAICVHYRSAVEYAKWLTARSGVVFRLATEAEWEHAAAGGTASGKAGGYWFGEVAEGEEGAKALGEVAWYEPNSEESPHPVGSKKANPWGLFDVHGNVAEWVQESEGKRVVKGGSWQDKAEDLKISARAEYRRDWQKTDPQIPKSQWWMSDGQHVGFRLVAEMDPTTGKPRRVGEEKKEGAPKEEPAVKAGA
jgi:formylglycine-generating enzyme required for sulfatase activity